MAASLSSDELTEVTNWLKDQNINTNKLNREFSDGIQMAHLLKNFYPRLVDIHNYPASNSFRLKLTNWETLNFKVLQKLGLHQNNAMLNKLAKGTAGAIESLLAAFMVFQKTTHSHNLKAENENLLWNDSSSYMVINFNKKVGDAIIKIPQKMVPFELYVDIQKEITEATATLKAFHQRIINLEDIILAKDEEIKQLVYKLALRDHDPAQGGEPNHYFISERISNILRDGLVSNKASSARN